MSHRADHENMDVALEEFVREVVDEVLVAAGTHPVVPDFAESVTRARDFNESGVTVSMLDDARALAPVIPIRRAEAADLDDPALASFLADVVGERNRVADRRKLSAIPLAPLPPRRHVKTLLWAIGACAAAVALWWGVSASGGMAIGRGTDEGVLQAPFNRTSSTHGEARAHSSQEDGSRGARAGSTVETPKSESPATLGTDDELDLLSPPEPASPSPAAIAPDRDAPTRSSSALDDELARLDEQAQAHLAAGERDSAESIYREIIRKGKRGRLVQLAYGDLFTVVRTTHGPTGEAELWQEYVRRFPHGPHADDARSGLCRRLTEGAARAHCWGDYLRDFPQGSHRAQAQREAELP